MQRNIYTCKYTTLSPSIYLFKFKKKTLLAYFTEQEMVGFLGRMMGRKARRRRDERWVDESESCEELRRVVSVYEDGESCATTAMSAASRGI